VLTIGAILPAVLRRRPGSLRTGGMDSHATRLLLPLFAETAEAEASGLLKPEFLQVGLMKFACGQAAETCAPLLALLALLGTESGNGQPQPAGQLFLNNSNNNNTGGGSCCWSISGVRQWYSAT
jgi:hypothetical protein